MWTNPQFSSERRNPYWETSWIIKQNLEHITIFLAENRSISMGHHYVIFLIENIKNSKGV